MDMSERIMQTITSGSLTFQQRLYSMAKIAEDAIDPIEYSAEAAQYMRDGMIYDMGEGLAPYRPRYCVPDYPLFMRQGSEFLRLKPPTDIWEAVGNLMCLYHNLSGSGGLPNYIGCLDQLLEPFIDDETEARKAIEMLLVHVDRTFGDAFCHANLGPTDTKAGRILLECTEKMQTTCPNMSLIYRDDTPDDYALAAIRCGLASSKPSFAYDKPYRADMGDYAVVSCYNVLPVGGSGMTLVRLNLHNLPQLADTQESLLGDVIPRVVGAACEIIDRRICFMVDTCHYFDNIFLAKEGLLRADRDHMIGMLGFVGLAECVNQLVGARDKSERYGNSESADALGEAIMDTIYAEMQKHTLTHGKLALHAQVGVMEDTQSSPGGRIPIGDEPDMARQITQFARMHRHCAAGCGELFAFDETALRNPEAILRIIKGAFAVGTRYISYYSADSDLVRVTGYLVKKSDIERFRVGQQTSNSATVLGMGITDNLHLFDRKLRGAQ